MLKTNIYYQNLVTANNLIGNRATKVLAELVTPRGIYASNDGLYNGRFHHYFGRDSAITAYLIFEAEDLSKDYKFTPLALQALSAIADYQGQKNNPQTGEEYGKMPHEIITAKQDIDKLQSRIIGGGSKQWFVDADGILKNWDSVDSTPLWMASICWAIQKGWETSPNTVSQLVLATKWCLNNLEKFGGLAGWLPSEQQPERQYGGLSNQAWKDSWPAFLEDSGQLPKYPLHDIFSSSVMWVALNASSDVLANVDRGLSNKAKNVAKKLKEQFNSPDNGFKLKDSYFYAEALNGNYDQLTAHAVDIGMAMAFRYNGQSVYDGSISHLVAELMSSDFYTSDYGLRTYSKNLSNYIKNDLYHRGPNTFWPFASALTAIGLNHFNYKIESKKLAQSMLNGLENFGSFVELFLVDDNKAELWKHAHSEQTSTLNQAWTAAGAYYVANHLLYL